MRQLLENVRFITKCVVTFYNSLSLIKYILPNFKGRPKIAC